MSSRAVIWAAAAVVFVSSSAPLEVSAAQETSATSPSPQASQTAETDTPRAGSDRLPLADVLAAASEAHPEVAAAEQRYQAAVQRPMQEGSLPDPMVSTGYTAVGNPFPGAGLGSDPNAEISVMVSQEIPFFGKRRLRADVARREAEAERQEIDAVRLNLTARVKQAYYRLAASHQLDDVVRRNEELLRALLKVSESRYAVGQAAQQDVIRTQTQLSLLALQRDRLARERRTREGELNALLNRAAESPLGRPDDLTTTPIEQALPALVQTATDRSPMLRRDQSMIARAEAALSLAQREFKPDFAVSGGYAFAGSMPSMFEFRFDVVLPLQRARRKAAVAEQRHLLAAARQAYDSTRLSLQSRLQDDYQMAATAGRLATLYRETVLPQARLALESSVSSYQAGTIDFLSVLTNFGSVLEYEMSYVEQLADVHVAASRLEEMAALAVVR